MRSAPRQFLCVIPIVLSCLAVTAQQTNPANYIRTDLISPSPTASNLGKFGEVPVTLYTGLPNLSIPIFEAKGNELSIPIALSYNYDGFKPNSPIGWVGIGWTLQAGGVITRTIRDKFDEEVATSSPYHFDSFNPTITVSQAILKGSAMEASYDLEPDVYNVSFPGYSGKFIFYRGKFYCFPYAKLKITGSGSSGFTIKTDNGVSYEFMQSETTTAKGSAEAPYNTPTYKSAWYLTKITNTDQTETITLSYTTEGQISMNGTLTQTYKKVNSGVFNPGTPPRIETTLFNPVATYPTKVSPVRLSSITTQKYTVTFTAQSSNRLDVNQSPSGSAKALEEISVSGYNGSTVKKFRFAYGYFGNTTGYNGCYLKLSSLKEYPVSGSDTSQLQRYLFEYEGESGVSFPTKTQAHVDHYGFYTGNGDFSGGMIPTPIVSGGPNRDPNISGTKFCALKKVTWPQGGNTRFYYEQNQNYVSGYIPVTGSASSTASGPASTAGATIGGTIGSFTLLVDQTIPITVSRTPRAIMDAFTHSIFADFGIYRISGGTVTLVYQDQIGLEADNDVKLFSTALTAGEYFIEAVCDYRDVTVNATAGFTNPGTVPNVGSTTGGLRLASIVNDPLQGNSTTKLYQYTDEAGFSSGGGHAGYQYKTTEFTEHVSGGPNGNYSVPSISTTSTISEGYLPGIPHFYSSVLELQTGGGDTLATRYNFENFNSYYMGLEPSRIISYKKSGGSYIPVKKEEYTYNLVQDTTIYAVTPSMSEQNVFETAIGTSDEVFTYEVNGIASAWKSTNSQRTVEYGATDSVVTLVQNNYDPVTRNLKHQFRNSSDGKSYTTRYKYAEDYTSTYNSAFISAFVKAPVWEEQVWRKTSGSDSVMVSGKFTLYNTSTFKVDSIYAFESPAGISAPDNQTSSSGKFNTLLSDSRYKSRIGFSYDAAGRMLKQQLVAGPPVSYKWGYTANLVASSNYSQKNYIVAEARNTLPTEFYTADFEDSPALFDGNTTRTNAKSHTGKYSGSITNTSLIEKYSHSLSWITLPSGTGRKVEYSVWVYSNAPGAEVFLFMKKAGETGYFTYVHSTETTEINKWVLLKGSWTVPDNVVTINMRVDNNNYTYSTPGTVWFDDPRMHLVGASLSTYTYEPGLGLTSTIDPSGQTTYYEYDTYGRVALIRDQNGKVLQRFTYHLKN